MKESDMQKISPFLWFDTQAEEAANFYVSLFDDAEITDTARVPEGAPGVPGEVMTVGFRLAGQDFTALNGGTRPRSTGCGSSSRTAAKRVSAAGSRIATASAGRSSPTA
jgi:predicted 3-demethylubiquinone-9 3-methyltransferase (glyoxalase superfamily)